MHGETSSLNGKVYYMNQALAIILSLYVDDDDMPVYMRTVTVISSTFYY